MDFIEVVVKEECVDDEFDLHLDPSNKCGEVFLGHRGNFTFVCIQCLQSFFDLRSFGEHIRDVHPMPVKTIVSNGFPDQIASLIKTESLDQDNLRTEPHKNRVEEEEPISKDFVDNKLCGHGEGDTSEEKATQPYRRKHSKSYCCFSCGKIFIGFDSYRKHCRTEHPDMIERDDPGIPGSSNQKHFVPKVPKEMICKYCLNTFKDPTIYHEHMETAHTSKRYSCPYCPKTCRDSKSRNYHIDTHEGKKPHKCPHCPKAFSHPTNLQTHINVHLNIKPHACQYCDNKYTHKSDLKIHERIHTKEKPFQCDECGMSFIAQVKLTNHVRRHKNIRNYKCPSCDKAFFNSRILRDHMITHTGERPYSCDICDQKFRASAALRSHKKLHLDTKAYACNVCGKTFAQRPGLYSHMKSHGTIK